MKATGPQEAPRVDRHDDRSPAPIENRPLPHPHFPPETERAATGSLPPFPASDHELTVIVPAYNEEHRLPATLDGLADYFDRWPIDYRVLVVDDGSTDRTARLTDGRGPRFSTISQPNRGKGAAVRNGALRATGRVVAFTDADCQFHLADLASRFREVNMGVWEMHIAKPIAALKAGMIIVSVADRQGNVTRLERSFSVGQSPGR
jgi:glycosyltransferase involved in cell wall biosynthesis